MNTKDTFHLRVTVLTNFIPPYFISRFEELQEHVDFLKLLLCVQMEKNRQWSPQWDNLNVQILRTLTINRKWHHPSGFTEELDIHFPYNILPVLIHDQPDIVLSSEMGFRTFQAVLYKIISPKAKLIIWTALSERTEEGRGWLRERLRSFMLWIADAALANGKSGAHYLQRFGMDASKIFCVPYTVDNAYFYPCTYPHEEQPLRLLIVGQLVERKGIIPFLALLESWVMMHPDKSVHLQLLGNGILKPVIKKG